MLNPVLVTTLATLVLTAILVDRRGSSSASPRILRRIGDRVLSSALRAFTQRAPEIVAVACMFGFLFLIGAPELRALRFCAAACSSIALLRLIVAEKRRAAAELMRSPSEEN